MKKYEHMVQELVSDGSGKSNVEAGIKLTEWGEMGWELVAVVPLEEFNGEKSLFYLKRAGE